MARRLIDDDAPETLAVWRTLAETYGVMSEIFDNELQAAHQLPLTWFDVLHLLMESPGGALPMNNLASGLLFSRSGVTRLVDRIEEAGLIQRRPSPGDRRVILAVITDKGRDAFDACLAFATRLAEERLAAHITTEEARTMRAVLERVLEANGRPSIWKSETAVPAAGPAA